MMDDPSYWFSDGLVAVYKDGKWGYIDKSGAVVAPFVYDYADDFYEGRAWVRAGDDVFLIDASGAIVAGAAAIPSSSAVLVDGEKVAFDAYNIADANYFKLRDVAFALNGAEKQFAVGWDADNNAISLVSGQAYTPIGGELEAKGEGAKTPAPTDSKIFLNGAEIQLTAYNIDGANYFKLRDIGAALGFGVDWDGANNAIAIDTSKGYAAQGN
jgi:hypothetical protein